MAGTRLLIQGTFLVQFLIVLGVALYHGGILRQSHDVDASSNDRLSIMLWQQTGRRPLTRLMETSPLLNDDPAAQAVVLPGTGDLPPARILCQDSQLIFWKDILQKTKLPNDHVIVQEGSVAEMCENPESLLNDDDDDSSRHDDADLIVCEFWKPRPRARLVAAGGTLVFYPRSVGKRAVDMAAIYPQNEVTCCLDPSTRIDLVLAVDARRTAAASDWKEWTSSLQTALASQSSYWHDLVRTPKDPIYFTVRVVHGADVKRIVPNNETQVVHRLDPLSMEDVFGRAPTPHNRLEIIMYLPAQGSTVFANDENDNAGLSTVMATRGSRFVRILDDNSSSDTTEASMDLLAQDAIQDATDWITRRCLGIPTHVDTIDEVSIDGSAPRWYSKLWWQRSLSTEYAKAVRMAQRQATLWSEMSYRVPLTKEVVGEFQERVLQPLERIPALLANRSLAQALVSLEASLDVLREWDGDETYMPPLDLPPEQYAAIFAPLVLPLFLPLIFGLIREYRRYRKLQNKKMDGEVKKDTEKKED